MPSKASIAATVTRAFDRAGDVIEAATLSRLTATAYGAGTTSAVTSTPETTPCRLLFDMSDKTLSQYLRGVLIEPTDKVIWMEAPSFAPKASDAIVRTGKPALTISWVDNVVEAGALYLIVAR